MGLYGTTGDRARELERGARMAQEVVSMTDRATADADASEDGKRTRERSRIVFPYEDLDEAVTIAKTIHSNSGDRCSADQLAFWLGHGTVDSGRFRIKLSTARIFNVIEVDRDRITLTPLGQLIVDPAHERHARVRAFLSVPLYREIFDRYRGRPLPPDVGLEREMQGLGVAQKQTDKARQAFQRSASQAGVFGPGRDRLVLPAGFALDDFDLPATEAPRPSPEPRAPEPRPQAPSQVASQFAPSQPARDSGRGGGSGTQHPLIEGLVQSLPQTSLTDKAEWSWQERQQWLQTAMMVFQLAYTDPNPQRFEIWREPEQARPQRGDAM